MGHSSGKGRVINKWKRLLLLSLSLIQWIMFYAFSVPWRPGAEYFVFSTVIQLCWIWKKVAAYPGSGCSKQILLVSLTLFTSKWRYHLGKWALESSHPELSHEVCSYWDIPTFCRAEGDIGVVNMARDC